jgi:hypothetical protein
LDVVSFPKEFDNNQIFNDLSIQTFPKQTVDDLKAEFWLKDNVPSAQEEE